MGYIRQVSETECYVTPDLHQPWNYVFWPNDPANYTPNPVMSGSYVINRDTRTSQDTQPNNNCQRCALVQVLYNMDQNDITLPL